MAFSVYVQFPNNTVLSHARKIKLHGIEYIVVGNNTTYNKQKQKING